ncbi:dipeptide ABC transporter ATP-binding protein [Flavihumibacter sp. RY-1]|uniref:Dipeptide ABC transporter ATP-binding protein n=1 Tax=Flavihumibacter fluminis TaxID=2909236 RepID=A0ABS9BFX5_9BACT|nr:dipeptide ABC transporter ATP-binding protein [Flavihumibacter fluminis]MCF1714500.1 dipeptide ABC transporter ATP-binding protein [Flavihumibacter fluminis]
MQEALPLLSVENLSVGFHQEAEIRTALHDISFKVNRGEIVAVVGESGSGKSVSSLSILQLLPQKTTRYLTGKIAFTTSDSKEALNLLEASGTKLRSIRGSEIAMIFQEPMSALNPVFTCGNQVIEAIRSHTGVSAKDARLKTVDLFQKVQLPEPELVLKKYPHQLSGGQKQRVMIAMALACEPSLLIADEPTTALDVTVQKSILELLTNIQEQTKMGMLFITHDLGLVRDFAHRVIVLYKGRIVEEGSCDELFANPQHPYTRALLACRPILYEKGQKLPVVDDFLGDKPVNKQLEEKKPAEKDPAAIEEGTPLISIRSLSVWYPKKRRFFGQPTEFTKAVDEINLDIFKGETLGIVGESGCGKTTFGRALLQLIPIQNGSIRISGVELTELPKRNLRRYRKEMQLVFQDPYGSLNPRIPIGEAIRETLQVHHPDLPTATQKEQVMDLLKKVHLQPEHYYRYPHAFSGGQRQRIGIARALALNPTFVVFDESVSALDVSVQAQVLNLINELKAEFGFTALFITHDLGVVKYISDRILVMEKGRIAELGSTNQVINQPTSLVTKRLLDAIPGRAEIFAK